MAYILKGNKPYYYDGINVFPCSISADKITVDFKSPLKEKTIAKCVYNEAEIKHRLGIMMINGWDSKKKKVIKISNQTVSSIPEKKVG